MDTFSPNETKVLAALSYFTSPMAVKFIAELASLNEAAAQDALSDLAFRALVIADSEERNFILTPMVADYLRAKRHEVVAETGNRLEEYAYALIVENGYEPYDRFPALDDAWPTISPALPLFVAGPNQRLQNVCHALTTFFEFTGRWDEWTSLEEQAETKAVEVGDHYNAGWRARQAGWPYYLRQQAENVLACAERASTHWKKAQASDHEQANAIRLRGLGYRLQKNYSVAIAAYRESFALWNGLSTESLYAAIALNSIADAEHHSGHYDAAERNYREALRISRAASHPESEAACLGSLAELALDQENWQETETLACEALSLSERVGRKELIALNCHRLAKALTRQGKSAEALPYAQRSVEIYMRLGSPDLEEARAILRECEF